MTSLKRLLLITLFIAIIFSAGNAGDSILILKFDCQGNTRPIGPGLTDSLRANLAILEVPTASRTRWLDLVKYSGYSESDLNYNPPLLANLCEKLGVKGAVYGQVYPKNGLIIMDAFYIEPGWKKPIDIDPMIGNTGEDIIEMTWELAVIISQEDKQPPSVVKVEPEDGAILSDDYTQFAVYFDEPMNPDSYGLTGEPEDMFFTVGDCKYDPENNCFKFKVHLYPGKQYKFKINGDDIKPFLDVSGNVALPFEWRINTK